jgi:hypothetical protein
MPAVTECSLRSSALAENGSTCVLSSTEVTRDMP